MATLNVWQAYELTDNGVQIVGGSRAASKQITVAGQRKEAEKSLATATTWDVWTTGSSEPLTDFDFLWVESDKNVLLELTVDQNNGVGTVVFAIEVQANVPFLLCADDAMANYTANFATGTEDVIDKIRIRNVSGQTAIVRVLLIT